MDFRYETSLEEMQIIGEEPSLGDMNIDGAMRLQPGAADSSIIYLRMRDLGEYRMPPLASSVVDAEGAEIIRRWIDTLAVILQLEDQESYIPGQPHSYYLFPVYPNPFNPTTKIKFALPEQTQAVLEIYNLHGQKIVTLVDSVQQAGYHIYQFDGTGLASGIYMCRLKADNYTMTRKLVLVR
jgi:hypothetical protein